MRRILLVDDHSVVRRGLREIIEDEIGDVVFGEAECAQKAIRQVWDKEWDVVVLDIAMPDRSGLAVLGDILDIKPHLPVLILSMHSEDQYGMRMLRAGASGYLTKESAPEELGKAIRRLLAGGRYISAELAEGLLANLDGKEAGNPYADLSDREYEVMYWLASGKTVSEIAAQLNLSVKTVSTYRRRVLTKLNIKSNAELMNRAIRDGVID